MSALRWDLLLHVWLAANLLMVFGYLHQYRTRNASTVDALWAAGMALAAMYYAMHSNGSPLYRGITAVLAGAWGLRLSVFILRRLRGEAEDGRYRFLRQHWRDHQGKFAAFYAVQAAFVALFSVPFLLAAHNPNPLFNAWTTLGLLIFVLSLAGESLADAQLQRHRLDPSKRGQACRSGLWGYSRHPNYFFEWLHWFAWVCFSVGSPGFALSLLGPLLMGVSLLWITGIPFCEAQSLRSRGDDYRKYQQETSVFFPWPPRR